MSNNEYNDEKSENSNKMRQFIDNKIKDFSKQLQQITPQSMHSTDTILTNPICFNINNHYNQSKNNDKIEYKMEKYDNNNSNNNSKNNNNKNNVKKQEQQHYYPKKNNNNNNKQNSKKMFLLLDDSDNENANENENENKKENKNKDSNKQKQEKQTMNAKIKNDNQTQTQQQQQQQNINKINGKYKLLSDEITWKEWRVHGYRDTSLSFIKNVPQIFTQWFHFVSFQPLSGDTQIKEIFCFFIFYFFGKTSNLKPL